MLDVSYHEEDGCHNCKQCFVMCDYDDPCTYYCTKDAPPRPKCGSIAMGRSEYFRDNDDHFADYEAWMAWSNGKEVCAWGMCGHWMKRELSAETT